VRRIADEGRRKDLGRLGPYLSGCAGPVAGGRRLAVFLAAVLSLVSCSSGSSTEAPPRTGTPLPSASTGGGPTTPADDLAAVEAAYRAFWPVVATFHEEPESRWRTVLGRVAVDPQLSFAIAATRQQRRNGITVYGQAVPRAPEVTFGGGSRRATVRDCADFSRTGQADARTKKRRTVGVARTPVSAVLLMGAGRQWRVSQVSFLGGQC